MAARLTVVNAYCRYSALEYARLGEPVDGPLHGPSLRARRKVLVQVRADASFSLFSSIYGHAKTRTLTSLVVGSSSPSTVLLAANGARCVVLARPVILWWFFLEGTTGFEPVTKRVEISRTVQLCYVSWWVAEKAQKEKPLGQPRVPAKNGCPTWKMGGWLLSSHKERLIALREPRVIRRNALAEILDVPAPSARFLVGF